MRNELNYPAEWKFDTQPYEIPLDAHRDFVELIKNIARGTAKEKEIYECFKHRFGDPLYSSDVGFALSDMAAAMSKSRRNAVTYIESFWGALREAGRIVTRVPGDTAINRILDDYDVPFVIDGFDLLAVGDVELAGSEEEPTPSSSTSRLVRQEQIGQGGFGKVFRVVKTTEVGEFEYAMKLLEPSFAQPNPERAWKRFKREVNALKSLQHRAIVPYIEAGKDNAGKPYVLMPIIDGEDVQRAFSSLSPPEVVAGFAEILEALHYAHENSVLHRDIKPPNILVRKSDRQPILLDFGCAFLLDELNTTQLTTEVAWSLPYVPNEVLDDPSFRDRRHDVYSTGVTLYQTIAGVLPKRDQYEPLSDVRPEFACFDPVIQKALARLGDRWKTAAEFRDALRQLRFE